MRCVASCDISHKSMSRPGRRRRRYPRCKPRSTDSKCRWTRRMVSPARSERVLLEEHRILTPVARVISARKARAPTVRRRRLNCREIFRPSTWPARSSCGNLHLQPFSCRRVSRLSRESKRKFFKPSMKASPTICREPAASKAAPVTNSVSLFPTSLHRNPKRNAPVPLDRSKFRGLRCPFQQKTQAANRHRKR